MRSVGLEGTHELHPGSDVVDMASNVFRYMVIIAGDADFALLVFVEVILRVEKPFSLGDVGIKLQPLFRARDVLACLKG